MPAGLSRLVFITLSPDLSGILIQGTCTGSGPHLSSAEPHLSNALGVVGAYSINLLVVNQVRIYRELAVSTGGQFNVCLDDCHLRDLLHAQLEPPPSTAATEPSLIKMGFPCHAGIDFLPAFAVVHKAVAAVSGSVLGTVVILCEHQKTCFDVSLDNFSQSPGWDFCK